ncbi:MAG: vWA domain-containing protein [Burkholderiales bacterium]
MAITAPHFAEIETKLAAARTRLILEKPFLGTLVMHLPLRAALPESVPTTATDARAFYYNPEYISALTLAETQFVLSHEALHCALGHFARRQHRTRHRWDVACDHAVNLLLVSDGLKPPIGALINDEFNGLTAEEIYPLIPEDTTEQPLDRHAYDETDQPAPEGGSQLGSGKSGLDKWVEEHSGKGAGDDQFAEETEDQEDGEGEHEQVGVQEDGGEEVEVAMAEPEQLGEEEKAKLVEQWRGRLASAAQQAKMAGRLGDSIARALGDLLQPQLPWRNLLARFMRSVARDDYSFQRPSRRELDAIMPSLYSGQVEVFIALDTSGSIDDREMQEFISEVDALKGEVRARITLHACDDKLCPHGPWVFEPWSYLSLPKTLSGGGGTRFAPVFDWIEHQGLRPDLLLYFTDADGEFPKSEPLFPVVWLVKGKEKVPWGERIQLN